MGQGEAGLDRGNAAKCGCWKPLLIANRRPLVQGEAHRLDYRAEARDGAGRPGGSFTAAPLHASIGTMTIAEPNVGKVYLVGAGPGDPGLITLRGIECLERADVVLYDYLVNPNILQHAADTCECICLGRHGRTRVWPQEEVNAAIVSHARNGKTVVRLKGGDPIVFGRYVEESSALRAAGIPFEVVPGITAALAAGSYANIPITHRDFASAAALITGQEHPGKTETSLDYDALARFPGTLILYMGVTTAPVWSAALMQAGKDAETPVAIVRRCSFPDQQTIRCTLGRVAQEAAGLRPPVLFIVGEVAAVASGPSWFEQRPLFGQRILVTRPENQAASLVRPFTELGAEVLVQPAIRITPPEDVALLDHTLARLDEFNWLVFSSANGVRALLDRLLSGERDLRALGHMKLAAIGPGTCHELNGYRLKSDLVPAEFRAESLAETLAPHVRGQRCLLVRASRGREVLAEQLRGSGAIVEQVVAYTSTDVQEPDPEIAEALASGAIDWVTVTSSAIARSLVTMFGDSLRATRLASISPITSKTLEEAGFPPSAEANEYTMAGVVEAIVRSV